MQERKATLDVEVEKIVSGNYHLGKYNLPVVEETRLADKATEQWGHNGFRVRYKENWLPEAKEARSVSFKSRYIANLHADKYNKVRRGGDFYEHQLLEEHVALFSGGNLALLSQKLEEVMTESKQAIEKLEAKYKRYRSFLDIPQSNAPVYSFSLEADSMIVTTFIDLMERADKLLTIVHFMALRGEFGSLTQTTKAKAVAREEILFPLVRYADYVAGSAREIKRVVRRHAEKEETVNASNQRTNGSVSR